MPSDQTNIRPSRLEQKVLELKAMINESLENGEAFYLVICCTQS